MSRRRKARRNEMATTKKMRRARKRAKAEVGPKREKGRWTIRRPADTALKAALADKQAAAHEETRRLQREIDASAERHKALKKTKEAEIAEIDERLDELSEEVRHGTSAAVDCYRHRDGDEWVYTSEDGTELDREPASDGLQQRLVGATPAKRAALDELLAKARGGVWVKLPSATIAGLLATRWRSEHPEPTGWPECELSWHPRVRWCQERLLREAWPVDGTVAEEPPGAAGKPLSWKAVVFNGKRAYRAEVPGGEYRVERGESTTGTGGKGLLRVFWKPTDGERLELPGAHVKVAAAKGEAEQHWQSRLRWLSEDPEAATQLDSTGKYQLMRDIRDGDWMAIYTGALDEKAKELGGGDIDEAKEACQDHADAGRWTR
jgi:hypothetical protein